MPSRKFPVGQFRENALRILHRLGVIDIDATDENGWYRRGQRDSPVFESFNIYDAEEYRLVPETSEFTYEASCRQCNASLEEIIAETIDDLLEKEGDTNITTDMRKLPITCSNCGYTAGLESVGLGEPFMFANQYFEFIFTEDIEAVFIETLESEFGCKLIRLDAWL